MGLVDYKWLVLDGRYAEYISSESPKFYIIDLIQFRLA